MEEKSIFDCWFDDQQASAGWLDSLLQVPDEALLPGVHRTSSSNHNDSAQVKLTRSHTVSTLSSFESAATESIPGNSCVASTPDSQSFLANDNEVSTFQTSATLSSKYAPSHDPVGQDDTHAFMQGVTTSSGDCSSGSKRPHQEAAQEKAVLLVLEDTKRPRENEMNVIQEYMVVLGEFRTRTQASGYWKEIRGSRRTLSDYELSRLMTKLQVRIRSSWNDAPAKPVFLIKGRDASMVQQGTENTYHLRDRKGSRFGTATNKAIKLDVKNNGSKRSNCNRAILQEALSFYSHELQNLSQADQERNDIKWFREKTLQKFQIFLDDQPAQDEKEQEFRHYQENLLAGVLRKEWKKLFSTCADSGTMNREVEYSDICDDEDSRHSSTMSSLTSPSIHDAHVATFRQKSNPQSASTKRRRKKSKGTMPPILRPADASQLRSRYLHSLGIHGSPKSPS